MIRTAYIVGKLQETVVIVNEPTKDAFMAPVTWTDGMVGAFAVFYDKEKAEAFAGGHYNILEVEVSVPDRS